MSKTYHTDYPTKPMGGKNPYFCCVYCERSEPEINGRIEGHNEWCEYRIRKEKELMYGDLGTGKVYIVYYYSSDSYTYTDKEIVGIFTNKDKAETVLLEKMEEYPDSDYHWHAIEEVDLNKVDETVYD